MASPPSLRTLYKSQHDLWSFSTVNQSSTISTSSSPVVSSGWDNQLKHKTLVNFETSRDQDGDTISVNMVVNGLLSAALMQYCTAAVAMPWEVGKLLLQIQYVPQELDDADMELSVAAEMPDIDTEEEQEVSM
jgi:fusion and transport protein UGO1